MAAAPKSAFSRMLDLPFAVAVALTVAFYLFVTSDTMKGSMLYRYTTEHLMEYVIVAFFIWGLSDVFFRALTFPREFLALRQEFLPRRTGREPASQAAMLTAYLKKKPQWLQESKLGQRLSHALSHLQEKGSADGFGDYLQSLADQDYEKVQGNYGLVRFICWVTPMFGFLGTVVHFGTALGGQEAGDISDKLPTVVAEMGTAFNTTTVALTAATTMMFALFLCERSERGIVDEVDRRAERELLNRFEATDANLAPFINALQLANESSLQTMDATISRQLEIWSSAFHAYQAQSEKQQQWQADVWVEALQKIEHQVETNDAERDKRLVRLLDSLELHRTEHRTQMQSTVDQVARLQTEFVRLVESLTSVIHGKDELVELQATLTDNLRILRETQQIDQALHGLTAAIHLMTARNQPSSSKELRAA